MAWGRFEHLQGQCLSSQRHDACADVSAFAETTATRLYSATARHWRNSSGRPAKGVCSQLEVVTGSTEVVEMLSRLVSMIEVRLAMAARAAAK